MEEHSLHGWKNCEHAVSVEARPRAVLRPRALLQRDYVGGILFSVGRADMLTPGSAAA